MKTKGSEEIVKYPPTDYRKLEPYKNKFVAFGDDGKTVVTSGRSFHQVLEKAWKLGVKSPLVMRVPKDLTYTALIV